MSCFYISHISGVQNILQQGMSKKENCVDVIVKYGLHL
jgi:hypothetical protein